MGPLPQHTLPWSYARRQLAITTQWRRSNGYWLSPHHGFMDRQAVAHEVWSGGKHLFQGRFDVVEIDVGDEAVNAGVHQGNRVKYLVTSC